MGVRREKSFRSKMISDLLLIMWLGSKMRQQTGQCVFTLLLMFAIGMGVPVSPLLASEMGATWVEIGLMGSAWGLVFTLSAFLTGRFSDKMGRKPVLAISAGLSALAAFLFLRATTVSELIAIRGVEGLAWACFWPPMEALATETAETEHAGRGIGIVTTVYAAGFAIGSLVGGFMTSAYGFAPTFMTYSVMACLSVLSVCLVRAPRATQPATPLLQHSFLSTLFSRDLVLGNLLGASYTFGLATVIALLSVYAVGIGIEIVWIGVAISVFWIGRILGAAIAGSESDRVGRKPVALLALIVGCIGFVMIGLTSGLLLLSTGAFLAGLSIGAVFPVNVAIVADGVEPESRGSAMGIFETACAIAFMVASGIGGVAAELVNPRAPYVLSAIAFVSCALVLTVLLPHRQKRTIVRQQM